MWYRDILIIVMVALTSTSGCSTTSDGRKIDELTLSPAAKAKWDDQRNFCLAVAPEIYSVCHDRAVEIRNANYGKTFPSGASNFIVETEVGWKDRRSQSMCRSGVSDASGTLVNVIKRSKTDITSRCLKSAEAGESRALASLKSNERRKVIANSPIYKVFLGVALAFLLLWTG